MFCTIRATVSRRAFSSQARTIQPLAFRAPVARFISSTPSVELPPGDPSK